MSKLNKLTVRVYKKVKLIHDKLVFSSSLESKKLNWSSGRYAYGNFENQSRTAIMKKSNRITDKSWLKLLKDQFSL